MVSLKAGGTFTGSGFTGGVWLHHLGFVGDVNFKTRRPGGFLTVSWRMRLPRGFTHPALRQGSIVEVYDGGLRLGFGLMADPDREGWTFVADGMPLRLGKCLALDASGAPTTSLGDAIDAAADRGWPLAVGAGVTYTALSTLSEDRAQVNTLPALLDAYCATTGQSWRVLPDGQVVVEADTTEVLVVLSPTVPTMATADDDYASLVVVRYASAAVGTDVTDWDVATAEDAAAAARWGAAEMYEDQTANGVLSSGSAASNAEALLDANRVRPQYAQGVEVRSAQATTPGGTGYHLPFLCAGMRVRQLGALDQDGAMSFGKAPEWVIGGTDYTAGARTITLTPADLAPRTRAQIIRGLTKATEPEFA